MNPTLASQEDASMPAQAPEPGGMEARAEAALVQKFTIDVRPPTWLYAAFQEMSTHADYVRRDCMALNSPNAVTVNHILRNQETSIAYLGVFDPQPSCTPSRRVGNQVPDAVERFAATAETWISHQAGLMKLGLQTEGAAQDASTYGFSVMKVTLQDDMLRDAIGNPRFGDRQELAAEYKRLTEMEPDEASPEFLELRQVEQALRLSEAADLAEQIKAIPRQVPGMVPVVSPLTGEPMIDPTTLQPVMEPGLVPDMQDPRELRRVALIGGESVDLLGSPLMPHFRGFSCGQVMPMDFRWDWSITRFEDAITQSEWMAHRVYLTRQQIVRQFKISKAEADRLPVTASPSVAGLEPTTRTSPTQPSLNDRIAVWEVYYRPTMHRYVFVEGQDRFLLKEVFQACGKQFFPFFLVGFNRVTGQFLPLSDVLLAKRLQDEINQKATWQRDAIAASFPRRIVSAGLLDEKAKQALAESGPFDVIETTRADEIVNAFKETIATPYDPRAFDASRAQGDMAAMFNLPRVVTGDTQGQDIASALALAKEGMETGVARRRIIINRVLTDIFQWMLEVSLKVFSEDVIKKVCGDRAVWPVMTTEQVYTSVSIGVAGGLQGRPRLKDHLDFLMAMPDIAAKLGVALNGPELLREMIETSGVRMNLDRFMPAQTAIGIPQAGPNAGPPSTSNPGGAPPMVERGAPSDLSQIPNHPPLNQPPLAGA